MEFNIGIDPEFTAKGEAVARKQLHLSEAEAQVALDALVQAGLESRKADPKVVEGARSALEGVLIKFSEARGAAGNSEAGYED